jgi:hypothetical protein
LAGEAWPVGVEDEGLGRGLEEAAALGVEEEEEEVMVGGFDQAGIAGMGCVGSRGLRGGREEDEGSEEEAFGSLFRW